MFIVSTVRMVYVCSGRSKPEDSSVQYLLLFLQCLSVLTMYDCSNMIQVKNRHVLVLLNTIHCQKPENPSLCGVL